MHISANNMKMMLELKEIGWSAIIPGGYCGVCVIN